MGATVILQGFGPDWEIPENPSQQIVEALTVAPPGDVTLVPVIWPNSLAVVSADVPTLMAEHRPDAWLGLGAAFGRPTISIERVAKNMLNFPYPDHDGLEIRETPINRDGPAELLSNLDVDGVLASWDGSGIPGYASDHAGGFMCNCSLYLALATARRLELATRCGFIHVPPTPSQVLVPEKQPSMDLALQVRAVELAIASVVEDS